MRLHTASADTLATTHALTLPFDHWYVQGFDARDVEDLGWDQAPGGIVVPGALLGSVSPAEVACFTWEEQGEPGFAQWYAQEEPEADHTAAGLDALDVLTCDTPDGRPEDPRTCSGRVWWLDNQGGQVCEAHTVAAAEV